MKHFVRKHLPKGVQSLFRRLYWRYPVLRRIYFLPVTLWDTVRRKHKGLVPPRSKIFVGDGNFTLIGRLFLDYLVTLCQLQPEEKVLEIGSGIGRMAVPLTGYLNAGGAYTGMDIVPEGIRWCQRKITRRFPNFTFFLADIFNKQYNPKGRFRASEYRFPFADGSFDFVFLTSVFTHMLPADVAHYLSEISRVLRPGGRCLITYFLLNNEARALLRGSALPFQYAYEDCLVTDRQMPEASIAHPEERIRMVYQYCGLAIAEPVRYGNWCGRKEFLSSQDIIIAHKNEPPA